MHRAQLGSLQAWAIVIPLLSKTLGVGQGYELFPTPAIALPDTNIVCVAGLQSLAALEGRSLLDSIEVRRRWGELREIKLDKPPLSCLFQRLRLGAANGLSSCLFVLKYTNIFFDFHFAEANENICDGCRVSQGHLHLGVTPVRSSSGCGETATKGRASTPTATQRWQQTSQM